MPYPIYSELRSYEDAIAERATLLGNLYYFATQRDSSSFVEDCMDYGIEFMPSIFADYGLRWNHLVEYDVKAIFEREPVKYFKPVDAWVDGYRSAHDIMYKLPKPGLNHISMYADLRWKVDMLQKRLEAKKPR